MAKLNVTINGNGLETIEGRKYLSKVKIGEQVYYLKDEEVRAIVAGLKEGAFVDVFDGNINTDQDENNKGQLVTAEQVKNAIAGLTGAMHFVGVKDNVPTDNKGYKAGDVILVGTKEYVFDGSNWVELGDETEFVKKTFTIAGIDMQDNISASELAKALEDTLVADLKGTGTAQTISGLKATGSLSGTATITTDTATVTSSGKYTPAGSITGSAISGGSISVTLADADVVTSASLDKGDYTPAGSVAIAESVDGTQITGTVSAPNITVTPKNATINYTTVTDAGTGYSLSNAGNATGTFASEGLKANVNEAEDPEMLVFTTAPTASVVYTAPVLSGSLPTFASNELTYVSGIDKATASAPVFTGDKFGASFTGTKAEKVLVTGVSYVKQKIATQTFTPVEAELKFAGTAGDVSVSGSYDKVNASAEVAVNNATLTVADINIAAQNVTISKK